MTSSDPLDDILKDGRKWFWRRTSSHRLALVRQAYTAGVPALLMKSSTDRLGAAAGYAFHLGTPDDVLRRIASWLLTEAGRTGGSGLWRLHDLLWARHGREDVALAALLLTNISIEDEERWRRLAAVVLRRERAAGVVAAEALLLSIEELRRAGRAAPDRVVLESWFDAGGVLSHLALLAAYTGLIFGDRGRESLDVGDGTVDNEGLENIADDWLRERAAAALLPDGDSLLGRIRDSLSSGLSSGED